DVTQAVDRRGPHSELGNGGPSGEPWPNLEDFVGQSRTVLSARAVFEGLAARGARPEGRSLRALLCGERFDTVPHDRRACRVVCEEFSHMTSEKISGFERRLLVPALLGAACL